MMFASFVTRQHMGFCLEFVGRASVSAYQFVLITIVDIAHARESFCHVQSLAVFIDCWTG